MKFSGDFPNAIRPWTEVFKDIMSVAAICVAGYWTFWVYQGKKEAQTARLNYEKLQKDLKDFRAVPIEIVPTYYKMEAKGAYCLSIKVYFENVGNANEIVYWDSTQVSLNRIWFDESGVLQNKSYRVLRVMSKTHETEIGVLLTPHVKINREYFVMVDAAGFYDISANFIASDTEQHEVKKDIGKDNTLSWAGEAVLQVK